MDLVITELRPDDWEQVRQIYLDGLATGQASFELEAPSWEYWDKNHHSHSRLAARHDSGGLSQAPPRSTRWGPELAPFGSVWFSVA